MQERSIRHPPTGSRLAAAAVAAVVALAAASVLKPGRLPAAEIEPVALIWSAPTGCPTTQEIHDEVARSLAGSLKQIAPVAAAVSVVVSAEGRWQANLVVNSHGARAERQFQAESCAAVGAAAALIIALAAEGTDDRPPPAPAAAEPPPPERHDGPTRASPTRASPMRESPTPASPTIDAHLSAVPAQPASGWSSSRPFLVLGGLIDGGTMPHSPATGVEAAAGGSWTSSVWRLRLIAGASFFLPEEPDSPLAPGTRAGEFWLLSFSGRGCLTAVLYRFELGPCLGAELVAMHATSIGGTAARSTQYWASPVGSAVAAVAVGPTAVLFARADVAIPGTRRTFLSDESGGIHDEIYRVPSFAVRGAAGIELRFF